MNMTTISHHVANTTSSTLQIDDQSSGGDADSVGAYTAVLAITAHIVAMLFGGGKSVAVAIAILTRGNIKKYSYLLVLTLLFACCCINFIYSPLEIIDLLTYHYHHRHPGSGFLETKTSLYIFLVVATSTVVVLITFEAIFRQGNCFGHILKKIWPLTTCVFALVWSAILTAVLISKLAQSSQSPSSLSSLSSSSSSSSSESITNNIHSSYVIVDDQSHATFLTIIILMISIVFLVLVVLLIQFLQSCVYWEEGFPHFHKKKTSLAMPEFLISQSQNDCEEEYKGGYDNVNEPSTSRSPSPSTPKLLMVSSPDSGSIKGGEGMPLSQNTPKSGNRLGINMAQVLGRRRHTICQISDSTTTPAPPDPISKAKQYNYVRKFSVDISALQAQLQNPKIFKEAPFQSDIDLTKKGGEGDKNNRTQKPLQPLQPLNLKLAEKKSLPPKMETTTPTHEMKVETPQSAGLSIPPPVIMVSNDDAIPEKEDNVKNDEKESVDFDNIKENMASDNHKNEHNQENLNTNNINTTSRPEIPTSLSLKSDHNAQIMKKDNVNNDVIVTSPTLESSPVATSGSPHDNTTDGQRENKNKKLARMSAIMCITFLITMLPVMIVFAARDSISTAFVSISTCTLAISTALHTVAYPHLFACCDSVIRGAVRRMNRRVKRICLVYFFHRDVDDDDDDDDDDYDVDNGGYPCGRRRSHNVDDTSSTSHV